jgi:hypothetical protein
MMMQQVKLLAMPVSEQDQSPQEAGCNGRKVLNTNSGVTEWVEAAGGPGQAVALPHVYGGSWSGTRWAPTTAPPTATRVASITYISADFWVV